MKVALKIATLWKCPKCGRQFMRKNQSHSCRMYPLEQHFLSKEGGKILYQKLCEKIKDKVGPFKIESLECCIQFVSTFTFTAVKIFKDKIQLDFSLNHPIKNKRIKKLVKLSAHRLLYFVEIKSEEEIDTELITWIKEAMDKK
ncbi:MAG: hypothetical protein IPP71_07215 [Bacteroidetes bacterium]|nr:hypothetical protein [Bacteroidota bacterium]